MEPTEYREMTDYERAVLDRLLIVDFVGAEVARRVARTARVSTMDACGCIEFEQFEDPPARTGPRVVAIGSGPRDADGTPVEVMLTLRGDRPLWLEFHRYSGDNNFWPEPDEWVIGPYSAVP